VVGVRSTPTPLKVWVWVWMASALLPTSRRRDVGTSRRREVGTSLGTITDFNDTIADLWAAG